MLESSNVQDLIDQLYSNYENLNLSHQAILQARSQLEILAPMGEAAQSLDSAKAEQNKLEIEEKKIPLYFNLKRKSHLSELVKKTQAELEIKESELLRHKNELSSISDLKVQLAASIHQDDSKQELEKTILLIKQTENNKNQRLQAYTQYDLLCKKLNLSSKVDLKTFTQNRSSIKLQETELEEKVHTTNNLIYKVRKDLENTQLKLESLSEDISLLKKNKGNLPSTLIKLREDLCNQLGVTKADLPFIAELIQILPKEKKTWNHSIEKLLRSFGLRLLVPSTLYSKINKYLSNSSIGIKLIYNKVDLEDPSLSSKSRKPLERRFFETQDESNLIEKLEFQNRSPYIKWLKDQLERDFDYCCTEELTQFQSCSKAIMPNGLIKRGPSLHEKDDRFAAHEFQSILGWDTSAKLNELQTQYSQTKNNCEKLKIQLLELEKQFQEHQDLKLTIYSLSQMKDFSFIDWVFYQDELDKLQKLKLKLETGHLSQWQKDLDQLNKKELALQINRDHLLADIAVFQSQLRQWPTEIAMCNQIIEQILNLTQLDLNEADSLFQNLEKIIKKKKIDFSLMRSDELTLLQRELSEQNQKDKKGLEQKIELINLSMIKKMTQFKVKFSEISENLQASMEYLPDFLALLERLQKESLPEHEKRF